MTVRADAPPVASGLDMQPHSPGTASPRPSAVARHTLYNALGLGAPLLLAVVTIPLLVAELGVARFGVLTLVWALVSYFGLFDLGLGRALTQQLAAALARGEQALADALVGTSMIVLLVLGLAAGVALSLAAPWAVDQVNDLPDRAEVIRAVHWMALAMPAIVLTAGLRGVLEARQAFALVNLIRLPMGVFTFGAPLIVVWLVGPRLDLVAAVLVAGRVVACVAHAACAWHVMPIPRALRFDRHQLKPLIINGGWLTASNIISPLMGYADRFLIGALVSAAAVAWYATPHELVSKLWIVPGALTAVLFPAFAAQFARDPQGNLRLFNRSVAALFALLLPLTALLALFANEGLAAWIDPEFAAHSALLLQIFALGTLINCLAHVPFTLIQSAGAARLTAMAHVVELPLFLGLLWLLTVRFGPVGAATAWLLRIVADTALMFELCRRLLGWRVSVIFGRRQALLALLTAVAFAGVLIPSLAARAAWLAAILALGLGLLWQTFRRPATA